ncbi:MAG: insulinase family protein, partial [Clostridiales bacterium]|nr:insulinase family protein [Clostridiales bacterium]
MFEIVTLDNGLRVALEEMDFVRSISLGIWVKNGSRNENPASSGISHFIEHMLFKGTDSRTAKQIADDMDRIGGHINAFTSKEYTCYYTRLLDTHFDFAIDVLSDMFFRSKFDDKEIVKERNVILEEIDMYEDTPEELVNDVTQYHVWPDNSLGQSILGTESTISKFDHGFFTRYFNANYLPERTVITIVGHFDRNETLKKIEERFTAFQKPLAPPSPVSAATFKKCIATKEKQIEQTHMCITFPGIPAGDKRTYDLITFNNMFGGGMSSRLFQSIREERGLA